MCGWPERLPGCHQHQYIRRPASSYASCIWCATACASCHGRTTKPSLAT
ncbi:heat-stable enterotoxin EAST1 [Escherichia coli]